MKNRLEAPVHATVAEVAVEGTAYSYDMLFRYRVAEDSAGVLPGERVLVPFGRGNRRRIGLVFSVQEELIDDILKPLGAPIDSEPVISAEMLRLCVWLRENTFCTYFDAFRAILPPGLNFTLRVHYSAVPGFEGELTEQESNLLELIKSTGDRLTLDEVLSAQSRSDSGRTLRSLADKGAVEVSELLRRRVGDETVAMLRPADTGDMGIKLTPKQAQVLKFVEDSESASVREVCYACAVTASVVKRMVDKGVLEQYEYQVFRSAFSGEAEESPSDIIFSPAQQRVFDGLEGLMNSPEPKCALLRGVTGSGKTSVFIRLIDSALRQGKTAIMMVPEISLTPQMVGRFRRLFGEQVAVVHSSLSLGERADEYRRIQSGEARIVIGTRSAVFAPVSELGIVVIDEEGESTYKSESAPRYHARDVAKQRCFAHNAFLLLASATPSLESYHFAKTGRYSLFELEERYNAPALPEVFMVDMRIEAQNGNHSSFSEPLINEINANLSRGEQSILLLNRRGYHTSVRCASCGAVSECPDCSLPLTYHKANESLICHCCGFIKRPERTCPKCGGKFLMMKGTGTQRIEDEISEIFPGARVLRMDADTTSSKNAFETKFKAFADGEYDIIVGTQMIAKGLDFPNVTLVGVLRTDNSLYAGDFRAYERTFSLITQVVGRSGRGGKKGRALLQTFSPEHYVLNLAARQDYTGFFDEEIRLREAMVYPPFCDVVTVCFSSVLEDHCRDAAKRFAAIVKEHRAKSPEMPLAVLGPAPETIGRANGRYRFRLILKCKNTRSLRALVEASLKAAGADGAFSKVSFYADMNGQY